MDITQVLASFGTTAIIGGILAWLGRLYILALIEREKQKNKQQFEVYRMVLTDEYNTYRRIWEELAQIYGNFHNLVENHISDTKRNDITEGTLSMCNDTLNFLLQSRPFIDDDIFRLSSSVCERTRKNLDGLSLTGTKVEHLHDARDRIFADYDAVCYRMKGKVFDIRKNAHEAATKKS